MGDLSIHFVGFIELFRGGITTGIGFSSLIQSHRFEFSESPSVFGYRLLDNEISGGRLLCGG